MKKILALLLAVLMVASLAACGGGSNKDTNKGNNAANNGAANNSGNSGINTGNNAGTNNGGNNAGTNNGGNNAGTVQDVTLKVWTSEQDQTSGWLDNRLKAFEAAFPNYKMTWDIGIMSEGETGNQVKADPSAAADVYMYANDQLGTLYEAGALSQLAGPFEEQVLNDNSDLVVNTVTYTDGGIYGFPTTNNTWFLYYNKDTYTAEDVKTMDSLLEKGVVSMQTGNAWYTAAFFTGNGGTIFGANGLDASDGIKFGGDIGYGAAEALIKMVTHKNYVDDTNGSAIAGMLNGSIDAMFSGSWDYTALYGTEEKPGMGEKLGFATAPTVTINGKQVQLTAFAGSKAVGVNPYCENQRAAMDLAAFLASKESQQLRFEMSKVTPCHKELAEDPAVLASEVAAAELAVMNNCAAIQPVIPQLSGFWTPVGNFGGAILNGEVTLETYKDLVDNMDKQLNGQGL